MADRLTTEEKIRRLQEQIEKLKRGDDNKPANLVYENKHFYVRRHARGRTVKERTQYYYILYSRRALNNMYKGKRYDGYMIQCDDYEEWFSDAEKAMEYLRSDEE